MRGDEEILLEALKQTWEALRFASAQGLCNRNVVLTAVAENGRALQYAADSMRDDEEVRVIIRTKAILNFSVNLLKRLASILSRFCFSIKSLFFMKGAAHRCRLLKLRSMSAGKPFDTHRND